ncbi:uncharacterized protein BO87DRAFT_167357 [Aspergillus neoniger CBS 115656]|uniref:Secreted protein n=1 Tax=Aspergillus neoniger (strain CBS 115656) TaxID=1448310 RepID=A0A318YUA6_ASPNB|nr:hypothetical protein BO87DRAFT_167357 [Aspergillus neoniger CBS 115656]PYH38405.1 hypothetical protein BO87DRAFT_167357 [Aspergillus neoniger CBS 115656]
MGINTAFTRKPLISMASWLAATSGWATRTSHWTSGQPQSDYAGVGQARLPLAILRSIVRMSHMVWKNGRHAKLKLI